MPRKKKTGTRPKTDKKATAANIGYEAELWKLSDARRGRIDVAKYKKIVLGLIYRKHLSDAAYA